MLWHCYNSGCQQGYIYLAPYCYNLIGMGCMTVAHHVIASFSPSCMVVFRRELVNTFVSSTTKELYSPSIPIVQNNLNMNIEVNTPRRRSAFSSVNNSRELSAHFSISSIERMKAQSNDPLWAEQVETEKVFVLQGLRLFYTTPKERPVTILFFWLTCPIHIEKGPSTVAWTYIFYKSLAQVLFHIPTISPLNQISRMEQLFQFPYSVQINLLILMLIIFWLFFLRLLILSREETLMAKLKRTSWLLQALNKWPESLSHLFMKLDRTIWWWTSKRCSVNELLPIL